MESSNLDGTYALKKEGTNSHMSDLKPPEKQINQINEFV
jgi:hypothetical protein